MRTADKAERAGNTVRAAIVRTKAARVAPAALTRSTKDEAKADLRRLTDRLKAALLLSDAEADEWMQDLPALLDKADQGNHPSEAALLFDLQQVGVDNEREIYALDIVEWLLSGGKRPVKRPLPSQRLVRITRHLRAAAQRLTQARLSDEERQHLDRLLHAALARTEERLRDCFRPVLTDALTSVGLQPSNLPEATAFAKMVEEMLDRIIEVGFLTFSDLRDAVSRNQLKMPDLADPQEFVRGDPLLRLDRRLATALDGVYRPSEFYLRWLERITSPLFGTVLGRWLTLFVLVPFGGALLLLDATQWLVDHTAGYFMHVPLFGPLHWLMPPSKEAMQTGEQAQALAGLAELWAGGVSALPAALGQAARPREGIPAWVLLEIFLTLGVILLGLLHSERLRRWAWQTVLLGWRALRGLFYDLPAWLLSLPVLRRLYQSWPFQIFTSFLLKPLLACALLWWLVPELRQGWLMPVITFLAVNSVLNSRLGRGVADAMVQVVVDFYDLLRAGLLPGLLRLVLALFKYVVDTTEYVLFTVDEWLRFRTGDNQFSMVVRTVAALLWYPIAFLIRFYLVVLIEPGFNPVKAPMSILAAKFMYPILLPMTEKWITSWTHPGAGRLLAGVFIVGTVWLLPDVFGFLAWEIKENWRLFRANRRPTLRPVAVGPRGETVPQLLQPRFHAGTVPRLYARLRHAERDALQTGSWRAARTCWHALQGVEKSLRRLVDREFVRLLAASKPWAGQQLGVGAVALAPNRVRIELTHGAYPAEPVWLEWQEQGDLLVAGVAQAGWLARVGAEQRQAAAAALAGLYKLAGWTWCASRCGPTCRRRRPPSPSPAGSWTCG
jgi:hypothetical protein